MAPFCMQMYYLALSLVVEGDDYFYPLSSLLDIADAVQVPCVANASLIDFNTSQPEFKIRRV